MKALEGARLWIFDSHVTGNVQGDEAALVHVTGGRVDGDIQIQGGVSTGEVGALVFGTVLTGGNIQVEKMVTDEILVLDAEVRAGNVQVVENVVALRLHVLDNVVHGDLQAFKNRGAADKVVRDNEVRQNLQCKENASPFVGGPNVAGEAEEQCLGGGS